MKKLHSLVSAISIFLLIGCSKDVPNELDLSQLTRVDFTSGNSDEEIIITEKEKIKTIRDIIGEIEWEENIKPQMDENEDAIATLFFTYDKNMPESLTEYLIWFNKEEGSAVIFDRDKNALGTLGKEKSQTLKELLIKK
ncbi:hypothetical protein [Cytobacillus oceanisediminis]|uniref:Lipoprotein n=1 Tax=Cytobacillus oceanisediminis 2691 TaxID=1196031 RepID=A0A160MBG4_9BACI|nr:hypothetical protein [Cytobacillus oceanisediminis]AND40207.1 hypothetical protein A361_13960 [Cytobacillus oceanisediminis 2691]